MNIIANTSLFIGSIAVGIAIGTVIGFILGLAGGYLHGFWDGNYRRLGRKNETQT